MKQQLTKILFLTFLLFVLSVSLVAGQDTEIDLSEMTWEEIVAQAQEEGELNWFHWYLQPAFREFVVAFEEEYGIEITIADGGSDDHFNKLLAESELEVGEIDVLSMGADRVAQIEMAENFVSLAGLEEFDNLITDAQGNDTEGYGVAFWGNQTGLAYRPDCFEDEDLPQTFEELDAWMTENALLFGIGDPNGGGAGPSFLQAMIRNFGGDLEYTDEEVDEEKMADWELAWEWLESQADNFVITGGNADSLTRINDGEFCLVPAWEDHLAGLQKQGEISEDIAFYIPEWGMNGGANVIAIPANAQNEAAAFVFVSWLTSTETQTELNLEFGSSPMHPDASDEFALVPNEQRAFKTNWMSRPYGEIINQTFIDRIQMG